MIYTLFHIAPHAFNPLVTRYLQFASGNLSLHGIHFPVLHCIIFIKSSSVPNALNFSQKSSGQSPCLKALTRQFVQFTSLIGSPFPHISLTIRAVHRWLFRPLNPNRPSAMQTFVNMIFNHFCVSARSDFNLCISII